jgi:hypothetical protein
MDISGKEVRYTSGITVGQNHKELVIRFTDEGNWFLAMVKAGAKVTADDGMILDSEMSPPDIVMAISALFHALRANRK